MWCSTKNKIIQPSNSIFSIAEIVWCEEKPCSWGSKMVPNIGEMRVSGFLGRKRKAYILQKRYNKGFWLCTEGETRVKTTNMKPIQPLWQVYTDKECIYHESSEKWNPAIWVSMNSFTRKWVCTGLRLGMATRPYKVVEFFYSFFLGFLFFSPLRSFFVGSTCNVMVALYLSTQHLTSWRGCHIHSLGQAQPVLLKLMFGSCLRLNLS